MTRLWFGKTAASKKVSCKKMTFVEFIETYLTDPKQLEITHEEFQALKKHEKFRTKNNTYITACNFLLPERGDSNAHTINMICLDIDDITQEHAEILFDGISIDIALDGFNWVFHTTLQSTKAKPRVRLFVEADGQLPKQHYAQAVQTISNLIEIPVARESKVISQPMFMPKVLAGEEYITDSCTTGQAFGQTDIVIDKSQVVEAPAVIEDDLKALSHMVAVDDTVQEESILSALDVISPDIDRLDWIRILCALKHHYQADLERGYKIFDEWSSKGEKYEGPDDTQKQWDYEKANPEDRDPITIRSIFKTAMVTGWIDPAFKQIANNIQEQIELCEDPKVLKDDIASEIRHTKLDQIDREVVCTVYKDKLKELMNVSLSIAKVRELLAYKVPEESVYENAEGVFVNELEEIPDWAKNFVYVQASDAMYHLNKGYAIDVKIFDRSYAKYLMTREDAAEGKAYPSITPSNFLLNKCHIPQYHNYVYLPGAGQDVMFEGMPRINTYRSHDIKPSVDELPLVTKIIEDHVAWILKDQSSQDILLDYLSYCVQHPGDKITWAILFQSIEGVGKTFFARLMSAALGSHNIGVPDNGVIQSQWTDWAQGSQIIFIEEIRASGSSRFALMDKLKPFTTNTVVTINKRNTSAYKTPNTANYIAFSNHKDALAIGQTDRRWGVLMSGIHSAREIEIRDAQGYFDKLHDILNYPGTIKQYFLTREITPAFNAKGRAPFTKFKNTSQELAKGDIQLILEEAISMGTPFLFHDCLSAKTLFDHIQVEAPEIKISRRKLNKALSDIGYINCGKLRTKGVQHTLWATGELIKKIGNQPEKYYNLLKIRASNIDTSTLDALE